VPGKEGVDRNGDAQGSGEVLEAHRG
jgi:hypothetical protein